MTLLNLRRHNDTPTAPTPAQLHRHYGRALRKIAGDNLWDGIAAGTESEGRQRFRRVGEYLGAQSEAMWKQLAKMPIEEYTRQMSEADRCS